MVSGSKSAGTRMSVSRRRVSEKMRSRYKGHVRELGSITHFGGGFVGSEESGALCYKEWQEDRRGGGAGEGTLGWTAPDHSW